MGYTIKQCMKISYSGYSFHNFILKSATDQAFITHCLSLAKHRHSLLHLSSTVEVEKGVPYKNAIKTKFRKLKNHLDQLLRLRLNTSQPPEFPFHNWVEAKHLRNVILQPDK